MTHHITADHLVEAASKAVTEELFREFNATPASRKSIRLTRRVFPSNDMRVRTASVFPAFCRTDAANPIPY